MLLIDRIRAAFAEEPTVADIEALIADCGSELIGLKAQAEAAQHRVLDLNIQDVEPHRLERDRLRTDAERLEGALEQLRAFSLPEAQAREQQARRLDAYEQTKAALVEIEERMERLLPAWEAAVADCALVVKAIAAVNDALPTGRSPLRVPPVIADEQILSSEQCLIWSQYLNGVVTPFPNEPVEMLGSGVQATLRPRATGLLQRRAFRKVVYRKRGEMSTQSRYEFLPDVAVEVQPPVIKSTPSGLKREPARIFVGGQETEMPM